MELTDPVSNIKFSQGYLMQLGDKILSKINRDAAFLINYGITPAFVTNLHNKNQAFKDFPTDEELLGNVSDLTRTKDLDIDNLKVGIRDIMVRVADAFPIRPGIYDRFKTKGMDSLPDYDLIRMGFRVVRMANFYLTKLAVEGLTQADIDALEALSTKADESFDAQEDAASLRVSTTRERILLANEVYGLITKVCDYGKNYWVTRNSAYYKDYVIYNTPSGHAELSGDVGSISGKLLDAVTLLAPTNGLITVEHIENPIGIDAEGNFACADVPIESSQVWASAANHITCAVPIAVQKGVNTIINIMIQPGTTPPPPGT